MISKIQLRKRYILGSANFFKKYGASSKKMSNKEIKRILSIAKKFNIKRLDTAEAYIKKNKIFKNIAKDLKYISKISPDKKWVSLEYCQKKLDEHYKILNTNTIETLLFHDVKSLFDKSGVKVFKNLEILKKKGYFKNIGVSIYETECLNYINSKYNLDVVQCPYNILDKRILTSGWYEKLKIQGIEIHIRSIFLQGLLVNRELHKKKFFKKWNHHFKNWFNNLDNNNISAVNYCITDLLKYDFEKIIIGIENSANLKEIVNFKKIKKNIMFDFKIDDLGLIDPRKWK